MNRAKNYYLFLAVIFTVLTISSLVWAVSYFKQSSHEGVTLGIFIFVAVVSTASAAAGWILWNKVRCGAENSRIAAGFISRSNKAGWWVPRMAKSCGIIAITCLVVLVLRMRETSSDVYAVWLWADDTIVWAVAAIGLYIYWKKKTKVTAPTISKQAPIPPVQATPSSSTLQDCLTHAGELEMAGERDKAIEQYTKAIQLDSKFTIAYLKRGMLLMQMGFKPAAVADLKRVIDISDNPELTDIAKQNMTKLG